MHISEGEEETVALLFEKTVDNVGVLRKGTLMLLRVESLGYEC